MGQSEQGSDIQVTQYGMDILSELNEEGGMSNVDGSEKFNVYRNNFYRKMVSLESRGLVKRVPAGKKADCDYVWFITEEGRTHAEAAEKKEEN